MSDTLFLILVALFVPYPQLKRKYHSGGKWFWIPAELYRTLRRYRRHNRK